MYDEKGLYLLISPSRGKWWRVDYSYDGKRKTISLGAYPDVSLSEARDKRDEFRKLILQGFDPFSAKRGNRVMKSHLGNLPESGMMSRSRYGHRAMQRL